MGIIVRTFGGRIPAKFINAFVAQSNDEAKGGMVFEPKAKFPPQDLFANIEDGISSCGLNGETSNAFGNNNGSRCSLVDHL